MRLRAISVLLLAVALAWVLPLLGLAGAGQPLAPFLDFPPRTERVPHAPFAWGMFVIMSIPPLLVFALYIAAAARARLEPAAGPSGGPFPWWGWLGFTLIALGWVLAWTEGLVPLEWRRHTFTPLWLGYVLVMNGLARRRTGSCPLTHRTGWFLTLFPVSAVFWWLFEHLNQFVGNWYYTGIVATSDWDYFLQAALPFSTVLPAVASTWSWLGTFSRLDRLALPAMRAHPALAWVAVIAGALALAGIGIQPEILYPCCGWGRCSFSSGCSNCCSARPCWRR